MKAWPSVFLLLGLILTPSLKLGRFLQKPFSGVLPPVLAPGAPLILRPVENSFHYRVSARSMSVLSNGYLLGAIDLNYENKTFVSGLLKSQRPSIWKSFFLSPEQFYFVEPIFLLRPKTKSPVALRFPTSVQKNVIEASSEQKAKEREILFEAIKEDGEKLQSFTWRHPLKSQPVGHFGRPRFLPDKKIYYHGGLDLRAPVGTPVFATSDGVVKLAQKMIVPGNVVVLSHGDGLVSLYFHLSQIKVRLGQSVKTGDLIALSGDTGRVEGPHLHWEIRWKGIPLDPLAFIEEIKKF